MTTQRHYSPIDRLLLQADMAMRTLLPFSGQPYRPSPAIVQPDAQMSETETRHVGLQQQTVNGRVVTLGSHADLREESRRPVYRKREERVCPESRAWGRSLGLRPL